jgi:hypothetical protein
MLFTIIDDLIERALVDMRREIKLIQTPKDKIVWIIQSHIKFYTEHRAQTKVLVHERECLEGEYAKIIVEKETEYVNFIRNILKEIIEDSGIDIDVNVSTFCLLGMLNWVIHWYNPEGKIPPEVLAENISTIFLKGLTGRAS